MEASDFDLSADELDEDLQENKPSSLLDIVSGNLDKDCSDGSDMDEDNNDNDKDNNHDNAMDENIEKQKESEEEDMEKLEIYNSKKKSPKPDRKASSAGVGG